MSTPVSDSHERLTVIVRKQPAVVHTTKPARVGGLTQVVLGVLCILWTLPIVGTLVTSFRPIDDVNNSGWWTVFSNASAWGRLTTENYTQAMTGFNMANSLINSFAITLPATIIPILIAAFAAYAFTFMTFRGKEVLFLTIVSLLVVPNYVAFVPITRLYKTLGMGGTFPAVWLAHIGFGMSLAIYILRNYMSTLPRSVIESAKIDGASHFQTFFKLILPMSAPALAAFAIFQFLWVWNDLLVALVFIGPGQNEPVTMGLARLSGQLGQGWHLVAAGGFLTMLVPLVVFLVMQRYFVRGLTSGAVKG